MPCVKIFVNPKVIISGYFERKFMFKEQDPAAFGVTPEMIEKAMSESFETLLDETFEEKRGLEGEVFKGIITAIDGDQAIVDIGMKSEGQDKQ